MTDNTNDGDDNGKLLVDFVGKFENLREDFKTVSRQLGFEDAALPHVNSSDKKSRELRRKVRNFLHRNNEGNLRQYVDFYDAETREYVAELYRDDIRNFGYGFSDALKKR